MHGNAHNRVLSPPSHSLTLYYPTSLHSPHPPHPPRLPLAPPTLHPSTDPSSDGDRSRRGHSGAARASDEELIICVGLRRRDLGLGRRAPCAGTGWAAATRRFEGDRGAGRPRARFCVRKRGAAPGVAAAASAGCPPFELGGLSAIKMRWACSMRRVPLAAAICPKPATLNYLIAAQVLIALFIPGAKCAYTKNF